LQGLLGECVFGRGSGDRRAGQGQEHVVERRLAQTEVVDADARALELGGDGAERGDARLP
jgi:hypothetical protein